MCLLLFAYNLHPGYRMILGANRDEFFRRPTRPLAFWDDRPEVLAGRDLKGNGTWLGVTRCGRLAALTNYRNPAAVRPDAPSRGRLASDFLTGTMPPRAYLEQVRLTAADYNGFNLIVGDRSRVCYYSNRIDTVKTLPAGLYGLCNGLLDTPWPKLTKGKTALGRLALNRPKPASADIFRILADRSIYPDPTLPDTGIGLDWERKLSAIFITGRNYGTRSSAVLLMETSGQTTFVEKTFQPGQSPTDRPETRCFRISSPPPGKP